MQKEPLHKYYHEYSEKEIIKIKNKHCRGCQHYGYSSCKKHRDDTQLVNRDCNYILNTEHRRIVRPELCPYGSNPGIELKEGEHYADFDIFCIKCKHSKLDSDFDPCFSCLKHVTVEDKSGRPIHWEAKPEWQK